MNLRPFACRIGASLLGLAFAPPALADEEQPPPFSTNRSPFDPDSAFSHADGGTLFRAICQGCHMPDAKGAEGAGRYPSLAADPPLASAAYPAITVLKGRHGMPPFGSMLSDAQVAAVVNYVRTHFDNHYGDALTADDVKKLR
ncbi:MAG: cytochrome c [Rudaea sp.]|uniref:c-type cytochrome n=1 Tax=Rudaea sp. TaxID=2136325 RepID=UPI0039E2F5C1